MAVAKLPDIRAKDIAIAPTVTCHTSENQKEHRSPYELYQMALPHIIDSNARVQRLIAIEKKKQKVKDQFECKLNVIYILIFIIK